MGTSAHACGVGDTVMGAVVCPACVGALAATVDTVAFMRTCCITSPREVTCSGEAEAEGTCVCPV